MLFSIAAFIFFSLADNSFAIWSSLLHQSWKAMSPAMFIPFWVYYIKFKTPIQTAYKRKEILNNPPDK